MSLNIEPYHNLIAYPDFDVDKIDETSLFWQIRSSHPFYTFNKNKEGKGVFITNYFHDPLTLQIGSWGSRIFINPDKELNFQITYKSPVKIYAALYEHNSFTPAWFCVLEPNDEIATYQIKVNSNTIPCDVPLCFKLTIPDTKSSCVFIKNITLNYTVFPILPEVIIGIVTFNRKTYISSLLNQIAKIHYPLDKIKVVVVDNASNDGTFEMLSSQFPEVTVLRNKENLGGAGGFNTFFRYLLNTESNFPFAWLIDDDASIGKYTLLNLVKTLEKDSSIGVAGSVMMDLENPSRVYEAGGSLYKDRFGWQANILHQEADDLRHVRERIWEVGYAGAYSLLFRTDILGHVGIWKDYFLHVDDSEWCYRIQKKTGKKVVIALDSLIWHVLQGAKKPFTVLRYYETRNFLNFFSIYSDRKTVIKVMAQCIKMGIRQLIIRREDLCQFHITGIKDFFIGNFGKKDITRSAIIVNDVETVLKEYKKLYETTPASVYIVREINNYINDGIDYETQIMEQIRIYLPEAKLIEVVSHNNGTMPQRGDRFYYFIHAKFKVVSWLKMFWRIILPKKGVVILPFWNETILMNNLAQLTAVYEDNKFSLYPVDRIGSVKYLLKMLGNFTLWAYKAIQGKYKASSSHVE